MNAALFRKELRDLMPWGVLGLALGLSTVFERLLGQVDLAPLGQTLWQLSDLSSAIYWFIAFAIGTGLATREYDDRTLSFLDGLPVSRTRVFLIKCGVMSALVLVGPIIEIATTTGLHLLSRGSLDGALHGTVLLKAFALQALLVVNGLMLGAALGRLRSLTWLVVGVLATALLLLTENIPRAAFLDPLNLLEWAWNSNGFDVDGETVSAQLAFMAVAAIVAWRGFVRAGTRARATSLSGPVVGAVVLVATLGVAVALVLLLAGNFAPPPDDEPIAGAARQVEFAPSAPAQTVTRHYRISYPSDQADAGLALASDADRIFERVHELLGVPLGDVIDVDASGSTPNTHGTAFFGRVQMMLDSEVDAVLAHETAHVVSQRVAGADRAWLWQAADGLNEGLASWVESRFRDRAERNDERMLVLAAMHTRRELLIEELADPAVLAAVRDQSLKYAAGEAIVAALVRLYGDAAVPRLLQAFADPALPTDLRGLPLWQSTLQLAGFDLAAVVDEFYRAVSEYAEAHAQTIAALPRPRVMLVRTGRGIGAMLISDSHPLETLAHEYVARFRPAPDSPLSDYLHIPADVGVPVFPGAANMSGGRVCIQPGVRIGAEVLYEPWTCIPTRDAVDLGALRPDLPDDA